MEEDKEKTKKGEGVLTGWVCPVCGSVYAIWVAKCSVCVCGPKTKTTDTTIPIDWRHTEIQANPLENAITSVCACTIN